MPSAWSELRLLLNLRWRTAWNGARSAAPRHRLIGAALSGASLLLFAGIWAAFAVFLAAAKNANPALFIALIERTTFFLFLFLLAGGIPFVSGVLLSPGDLPLLAAAPVRPTVIVMARLLDAITVSSAQFLIIGVPLLLAAASALHLSTGAWVVFALLLALFLALPALLVAALLLALARTIGVRHLKTAVAIASAILSLLMCLLTVREVSARASGSGTAAAEALMTSAGKLSVAALPLDRTPPPAYLPSTWAAHTLLALGNFDNTRQRRRHAAEGMALLVLLTLLVTGLCLMLGGPVLVGERLLEQGGGSRRSPNHRALLDTLLLLLPLAPPTRALIAKDLRYVARDLVLLSQIGIPVILYLVPFVIAGQLREPASSGSGDILLLSLGIVGTIVYMETSILSLSSVGLEGQSFWLVLASPVSSAHLVRAKFLFAFLTSLAVGAPLFLVSCFYFQASASLALGGLPVLLLSCGALCGLGVGVSGLFPRFHYDNPAHRASLAALIWGFVGATLYLLVASAVLGGGFLAASQWPERRTLFIGSSAALYLLLSLGTATLPLLAANARLNNYAWQH